MITTPSHPLPRYEITWEFEPPDWERKVISLQNLYLEERGDVYPRRFNSTLQHLITLAIGAGFIDIEEDTFNQAIAWAAVNLFEIYKIFFDPLITEAFCNAINDQIIITHFKLGRYQTNIRFTEELWSSLKIRCEYDSGQSLTPTTPALKVGLVSDLGNFRVSLQDHPLSPNGPTFNIRRLPANPYPIDKLVRDNQLSAKLAETLVKAIKQRNNIIIAGEPGSGKTTLANSLLLHIDASSRLIIMEDAREVIVPSNQFPMAVHFSLPTVGDNNRFAKRSHEISRLLHRSPDYVFLGEIQNAEDTKVSFEGFAAGLRGIATSHATDLKGLLDRWTLSHELSQDLVNTIDVIIITKRNMVEGKIRFTVDNAYFRNNKSFEEFKYV